MTPDLKTARLAPFPITLPDISYDAPLVPTIRLDRLTASERRILREMWQLNAGIPMTATSGEIRALRQLNHRGGEILAKAKGQTLAG